MIVTIRSEKAPQDGQNHRSSNNFTTAEFPEKATLTFKAFYNYGTQAQKEATDIIFDVKVDKTGHDPMFLDNISSGYTHINTHHRNLYIADPRHATEAFTVEVQG